MFGFLKRRKREKAQHRELRELATVFATLERLEKKGLIAWDDVKRRMYVSETLAALMSRTEEGMVNFMDNLTAWCVYSDLQRQWEERMREIETDAVREALKEHPNMTNAEIRDLRMKTRVNTSEEAMTNVPSEVNEFEFYVVGDATIVDAGSGAIGKVKQIGIYNPETGIMERRDWR